MVVHFTVPFHLAFLFFSRFNRKPRNGGSSCSTVRGQTCPGVEQLVQLLGPHISPSRWDSSCASLQRPARSATNLHVAWAAGKRGKSMGWGWEDWCDFTVWFLAVEYKTGLLTSSVPRMGTAWELCPVAAPKAGNAQPQRLETQPSAVLLRNSFSTLWK